MTFSGPWGSSAPLHSQPLGPPIKELQAALDSCETALRQAGPRPEELEFSWRATDCLSWWQLRVRTPMLSEPVSTGYSVSLVGSEFDPERRT